MLAAAVDRDVIAAFADDVPDRLGLIDLPPHLIEIGDLEIRAELDRAVIRLDLPEQDAEQSRLADAVVTDDPDALAAHDPQRKVLEQSLAAVAVADVARFDDLAAGQLFRLVHQNASGTRPFDAGGGLLTQ